MRATTLATEQEAYFVTGAAEAPAAGLIAAWSAKRGRTLTVILLENLRQAEAWAYRLQWHATAWAGDPGREVLVLPNEADPEEEPRAAELAFDRQTVLSRLVRLEPSQRLTLVTTPGALFQPVESRADLSGKLLAIRAGEALDFGGFVESLASDLGYDSEVMCEQPGQFAVRGGLVDVYPVSATEPVRIDFFGNEVESIRIFDPTTQRSGTSLPSVSIPPLPGAAAGGNGIPGNAPPPTASIEEYLPPAVDWVLFEPTSVSGSHYDLFHEPERFAAGPATGMRRLIDRRAGGRDRWLGLSEVEEAHPFLGDYAEPVEIDAPELEAPLAGAARDLLGQDRQQAEREARRQLLRRLAAWQRDEGYRLVGAIRKKEEAGALEELLAELPRGERPHIEYAEGDLGQGFRLAFDSGRKLGLGSAGEEADYPAGLVVVTERELFNRPARPLTLRRRKLPNRAQVDQALDFSELADGDYLVHLQHGVCIFRGLTRLELRGREEEVFSLEFAEAITLHLPLHDSHLLSRYVGLTKSRPRLGKLGNDTWKKTRKAAEKATVDFAAELLRLQAVREAQPGFPFASDNAWQQAFEEAFPFTETRDQLGAIVQTKQDMELERPMDRLVCGDVGYGKTEVALRAAFKAVMSGKQVAVLVPTTVLAQQHHNTFRERLAPFPVVVEMVSRFRTPQQQRKILAQLKEGRVDIVVGTHRLISRDVRFKDLGLIIVDEEHRFGVRQKEQLKRMRISVDVLAMSATPIPRSLYLALVGARDLSVIETPPVDRLPIQTYVRTYDPELVKQAIERETSRGGQVFYLHNRVQTIESTTRRLQQMLPGLRIAMGHGQMEEDDLERIMTRFVAGEHDVLVCTTIIESGLDIPNCNTIIIEGADRFGLSQLYQLRGRVGRFKRQAYAYLLLHRQTKMLDPARKRLSAMKQYNQLGAGFRIAMRDLELRGAGNLLGAEQSGHIAGVGFDLYCQLLRQSIARLKGEPGAGRVRATLRLDFVESGEGAGRESGTGPGTDFAALREPRPEIHRIDAVIPARYIEETRLRIDLYRRLSMVTGPADAREIGEELKDRFGPLPDSVQALILTAQIRCAAEQASIREVETDGDRLKCRLANSGTGDYLKSGSRFPRLTARQPLPKLREILRYLMQQNLHSQ